MPRTSSAKKALRQSARKELQNKKRKTTLKKLLKEYRRAVVLDKEKAKIMLPKLYQAIDKAVKTHVLARGRGNRMKSRLVKKSA